MKERQCNVRRWLIAVVAAMMFVFIASGAGTAKAAEAAAGWVQDGTGWRYLEEDGTYISDDCSKINGKVYYFGEDSYMRTGWIERYDDIWYYADASGALLSGWHQIGGTWYYFYWNGQMAADTWVKTNGVTYYVNASGAWVDASNAGKWIWNGIGWWYQYANGNYPYDDVVGINGVRYGFDENGYMVTGWYQTYWGSWYYFNADGSGADGWRQINGVWYYFDDGWMYSDTWVGNCWVDENGAWQPDRTSSNTGQWMRNATGWWYQRADGSYLYDGVYLVNGTWYGFNEYGYMVTGWYDLGYGDWCYFDASGAQVFGWQQIGGTWYYFDEYGYMYYDTMIDGYYLNESGAWVAEPSYAYEAW